jgi:ParB/RepB/Spo0J family partition protein
VSETKEAAVQLTNLAVTDIDPSPYQMRQHFDVVGLKELAASIRSQGLLSPILVRPKDDGYELVAGERRLRAVKTLGWETIPAQVRELSDDEAREAGCAENLERESLLPLEAAAAIAGLVSTGKTAEQIAEMLGKSPGWVAKRAKLNDLSLAWREAINLQEHAVHLWPAVVLELVARLPVKTQDDYLDAISKRYASGAPTAEQVENELETQYSRSLDAAPWGSPDELQPVACCECMDRTDKQLLLFEELQGVGSTKNARCLNPDCWAKKQRQWNKQLIEKAAEKYGAELHTEKSGNVKQAKAAGEEKPASTPAYNWGVAKKGDKDAKPVLTLDGPDAGKVTWMKPREGTDQSGAQRGPGRPKIDSEAERKKQLAKRRDEEFCGRVGAKLVGVKIVGTKLSLSRLLTIAVAFANPSTPTDACWKEFDRLSRKLGKNERELAAALVQLVAQEWCESLSQDWASDSDHATRICELFGFDAKALQKEAEKAVPEPKEWAKKPAGDADDAPAKKAKAKK